MIYHVFIYQNKACNNWANLIWVNRRKQLNDSLITVKRRKHFSLLWLCNQSSFMRIICPRVCHSAVSIQMLLTCIVDNLIVHSPISTNLLWHCSKTTFSNPGYLLSFLFVPAPSVTMLWGLSQYTATNNPRLSYLWMLNECWCLSDKESTCNAEDLGSIPGSRIFPWRREWLPTPISLPGKSHGQKSLVGCSPWNHKELDMTERLTLFTFMGLITVHCYWQPQTWLHKELNNVCWIKGQWTRSNKNKGPRDIHHQIISPWTVTCILICGQSSVLGCQGNISEWTP